jgi:hypothetical protein
MLFKIHFIGFDGIYSKLISKSSNETVIHTAVKDTVIISNTAKDLIALFAGHVARMYQTDRYHPN